MNNMNPQSFGSLLKEFRQKTYDPKTKKTLTQKNFGEYLFDEIGISYSGAAVSDWEREQSDINIADRLLLVSIIKILKKYGGIQSLAQANYLLESGDYRALNSDEQKIVFPETLEFFESQETNVETPKDTLVLSFIKNMFFDSPTEFNMEWKKANEGPVPILVHMFVAIIRKQTDKISPTHAWRFILWIWIVVITYWLVIPSLQFPFSDQQDALNSMFFYIIGSFVLPFGIGLMVNIKNNAFWKEQKFPKPFTLRLYVFQGAYVGFQIIYFFMFFIVFLLAHFQISLKTWGELLGTIFLISITYASAQLVPYNLWRAYQRLDLKDGWVFFIFVIIGPFWAWFFLEFYNLLFQKFEGVLLVLLAITGVIVVEKYKILKHR